MDQNDYVPSISYCRCQIWYDMYGCDTIRARRHDQRIALSVTYGVFTPIMNIICQRKQRGGRNGPRRDVTVRIFQLAFEEGP